MGQAFNDAVAGLEIGQTLSCPPPVVQPDIGKMWLTLESRNEHGLCKLRVTWMGIFVGFLYGKADGSLAGWRFSSE